MATPAVVIAPVPPGTDAQEDAVIEVAGAIEADWRTGVGCVIVITVGADRRRSADVDGDLRVGLGHHGRKGKECRGTEERFPSTLKELDAGFADGEGSARWVSDFH